MSLLILRGILLTLEALAISALLPLLTWAVGALFRKNAAMRHLLWLAGFGVLLALPLLALLVPPRVLALPAAPPVPVDVAMAAPVTATYAHSWSLEEIIALAAAPLCALWLVGVAWNLLRLALGAHGLWRLRRGSEAFDRVGGCEVRLGNGGPLTFGVLKPIIILPYDAPRWSRERREAVLRHELAHVRRRDSLTQWLASLACAFYWPNPLVWLGARALRRDAEMAADDAVLASGIQPSLYAAELLRLAADRARSADNSRFAVAMASPSSLEARVTSVLSPTPSRAGVSPMTAFKLALLGGSCALALAFARPDIALAQAAQPAPVAAAPLPAPAATPAPAAAPAPQADAAAPKHRVKFRVITYDDKNQVVTDDEHGLDVPDNVSLHGHLSAGDKDIVIQTVHGALSDKDKAEIARAQDEIHRSMVQVKVQMANIHPQIERAMAQVRASQENAQAWREASRDIHRAVEQAMAEARPYIDQVAKDPHVGEKIGAKIAEAWAKAQPRIDAAIARANSAHVRADIEITAPPPAPPAPMAPMAPMAPPAPAAPPAPPAQ